MKRYRPYLIGFYVLFLVIEIAYSISTGTWRLLQGVLIGFTAALILFPPSPKQ